MVESGVVFSNVSYMKKDAEAALVRQNAEYLSNRLDVLQRAEEANRRLRHDMRHHMNAIAEYAKTGDTFAILSYIGGEIDLNALFGNLLENALHGCQESGKEKQCIEIHIRLKKTFCSLFVITPVLIN